LKCLDLEKNLRNKYRKKHELKIDPIITKLAELAAVESTQNYAINKRSELLWNVHFEIIWFWN